MVLAKPPRKSPVAGATAMPTEPVERPIITFAGDGCLLGHWRGVAVGVWRTRVTFDVASEVEKLLLTTTERSPKFSSVQLIDSNLQVPTAETRTKLGGLARRYGDRLVCSATMLSGAGFWASAMRGILTSIQVFTLRGQRQRIFSNVEELANWLAPLHSAAIGQTIDPEELQQALHSMLNEPSGRREQV